MVRQVYVFGLTVHVRLLHNVCAVKAHATSVIHQVLKYVKFIRENIDIPSMVKKLVFDGDWCPLYYAAVNHNCPLIASVSLNCTIGASRASGGQKVHM